MTPTNLTRLQKKFIIQNAHLYSMSGLKRYINENLNTGTDVELHAVRKYVLAHKIICKWSGRGYKQGLSVTVNPVPAKPKKYFDVNEYNSLKLFVG